MRNSIILTIVGFGLLAVLVTLDLYANNMVETNIKKQKEVYSFSLINSIQDTQFTISGMTFGVFASSFIVQLTEALARRKERKEKRN